MKSGKVLEILQISRVTLWSYVKNGQLKVTKKQNGYYDYDDDSVYKLAGKTTRKNVIYARVSTYKQKDDLSRQIDRIKKYCNKKKIKISETYSDIHSGIDMERTEFTNMLNSIFKKEIDTVYISNKDRLTRLSFITLESILNKFGTKIDVINKTETKDDNDIFQELMSIMHYFSSKTYSNRRKKKMDLIKQDLELENEK